MAESPKDKARKREAERILKRVETDDHSPVYGWGKRTPDEEDDDQALLKWGKLIGRTLAVIFIAYLLWSLYNQIARP